MENVLKLKKYFMLERAYKYYRRDLNVSLKLGDLDKYSEAFFNTP
jgi:hypothetical protein